MGEEETKFWLCWVEGTDGGFHYRHSTLEGARVEAERLARNTERKVYVLEMISFCIVTETPVTWVTPLPF